MVVCIISNKDSKELLTKIIEKGYSATKLASTGGFLKEGNTTLLIGVPAESIDEVIEIISSVCEARKRIITPITALPGTTEAFMPFTMEVTVGGATIFVLDVEKHMKV